MLGYTDDEIRNFKAWDWDAQMSEGQILARFKGDLDTDDLHDSASKKERLGD